MARTATQVFFFVPNLIGYARVALSVYSLAVALTDFKTSVACYALSFACDYFDGFFARWFDQCACLVCWLDRAGIHRFNELASMD